MRWILVVVCWASPALADPQLVLPQPVAPKPQVIREETPGPLYYRLPPDVVRPLYRTAVGMELRSSSVGFALDLLAGAAIQFGRGSKAGMWIEGGYSYAGFGDHLLVIGAGPSVRGLGPSVVGEQGDLGFALVPHAVVGRANGELGYGLRTSAIAKFWLYGLEFAHQYLIVDTKRIHEVHLMLTFPMTLGGHE